MVLFLKILPYILILFQNKESAFLFCLIHTNATLLISQNIDVAVVAARLGHAQITTTYNFYVHPIISHNRIAGNVLQNLLLQKN